MSEFLNRRVPLFNAESLRDVGAYNHIEDNTVVACGLKHTSVKMFFSALNKLVLGNVSFSRAVDEVERLFRMVHTRFLAYLLVTYCQIFKTIEAERKEQIVVSVIGLPNKKGVQPLPRVRYTDSGIESLVGEHNEDEDDESSSIDIYSLQERPVIASSYFDHSLSTVEKACKLSAAYGPISWDDLTLSLHTACLTYDTSLVQSSRIESIFNFLNEYGLDCVAPEKTIALAYLIYRLRFTEKYHTSAGMQLHD